MRGLGLVTYATSLKRQAKEELMHAELLSNRISELGDKASSDPSDWKTLSNIGPLDPTLHLTLRSSVEKALEIRR
jgi:ferritin-like protein